MEHMEHTDPSVPTCQNWTCFISIIWCWKYL